VGETFEHAAAMPSSREEMSRLTKMVSAYRGVDTRRSITQLSITFIPFAGLIALMLWAISFSYLLSLAFVVPAAGLLVRLFMIQHDCGHGAYFKSRAKNDWVGRIIGVLTLTPYHHWRKTHAAHHATTGNLDRRGKGDITTLTVSEYRHLPKWRRFLYRLYRHPLVLFGLGPIYHFVLQNRLPTFSAMREAKAWSSVLATNAAIAAILVVAALTVGFSEFLIVYMPVVVLAGAAGIWLFYVQHQFEDTYWEEEKRWSFQEAALKSSSFYDMPRVLHWLTADIGLHHIHHLCSKIPNYRLRECLNDHRDLLTVNRIGLRESLKCARLALWDEEHRKLIRFSDLSLLKAA
jgi:omega-6 fatty acid desaturase (delta-12 desaturase)